MWAKIISSYIYIYTWFCPTVVCIGIFTNLFLVSSAACFLFIGEWSQLCSLDLICDSEKAYEKWTSAVSTLLLNVWSLKPSHYQEWPRNNFTVQHQYTIKQTSGEKKEMYRLPYSGEWYLNQCLVLRTNIIWNV